MVPARAADQPVTITEEQFEEISNIIRMVDDSDIVELDVKSSALSVSVKKAEALEPPPAAAAPMMMPQMMGAPMPMGSLPPAAPAAEPEPAAAAPPPPPAAAPAADAAPPAGAMLSPMAGTMYRCPAPGEPPFVKVGDSVTVGQTLCIIEAMKLMNEIEAEVSGTVKEILTDDGGAVDVGTPLILIG
eukprot:PRCOL_00000360-RA